MVHTHTRARMHIRMQTRHFIKRHPLVVVNAVVVNYCLTYYNIIAIFIIVFFFLSVFK